jgi:large conductance mechanosensitive channel
MSGFRKFILRGNLVDLAVAVVIGTQFSDLVKQFVSSFINPLLSLVGGKPNFDGLVLTIHGSNFKYGAFLTAVISFIISAAVVYFVIVLPVARFLGLFERDVEASERDCPECTRSIPIQARRCPECTAQIAPAAGVPPTVPSPRRG